MFGNKDMTKQHTFDHNGGYLPIQRVNTARLPKGRPPVFELKDPNEETKKGKKKKPKKKAESNLSGLDPDKIIKTDVSESEYIEQLNDFPPNPSQVLQLNAGVNLEENG